VLEAERLVLEPLTLAAADEMVAVLASPTLYEHTGGTPPDLPTLRRRYAVQATGWSPDRSQRWLNWVARERDSGAAVGYVQATVTGDRADVAWVVGADFQGRGYATEAARAMVAWLASQPDVRRITAHIGAENAASQAVARHVGFLAKPSREDGEPTWELGL
jgi:RimJ/RimL family protein N-acetyltransferase